MRAVGAERERGSERRQRHIGVVARAAFEQRCLGVNLDLFMKWNANDSQCEMCGKSTAMGGQVKSQCEMSQRTVGTICKCSE